MRSRHTLIIGSPEEIKTFFGQLKVDTKDLYEHKSEKTTLAHLYTTKDGNRYDFWYETKPVERLKAFYEANQLIITLNNNKSPFEATIKNTLIIKFNLADNHDEDVLWRCINDKKNPPVISSSARKIMEEFQKNREIKNAENVLITPSQENLIDQKQLTEDAFSNSLKPETEVNDLMMSPKQEIEMRLITPKKHIETVTINPQTLKSFLIASGTAENTIKKTHSKNKLDNELELQDFQPQRTVSCN